MLNYSIDIGCRHLDTANAYGNEELIGNVLEKVFASGKVKREEMFITSKLINTENFNCEQAL